MDAELEQRLRERLAAIQGNLEAIKTVLVVLAGVLFAYLWHVW